jgi:hypothetical protein
MTSNTPSSSSNAPTSSLHALSKPSVAPKPSLTYQNSPSSFQNSPVLPQLPENSPEFDGDNKAALDPKIINAIGALMDERLKKFAGLVGTMENLKPNNTNNTNKPTKPAASQSLLTSLKSHYGGPPAASLSASYASSSVPDVEDGGGDGGDDDDKEIDTSSQKYATVVLANASTAGSVLNWVKAQTWNHSRSMHECIAIAAAIDAFLAEGLNDESVGMEILCRRLSGVHAADKFNNWDLCKVVEYPYASESLLNQQLLSRAVKDASARVRLLNRASKSTSSARRGGVRSNFSSGGRNNNNNNNNKPSSFKSKFGAGSASASAARN